MRPVPSIHHDELPPYRLPALKSLVIHTWRRENTFSSKQGPTYLPSLSQSGSFSTFRGEWRTKGILIWEWQATMDEDLLEVIESAFFPKT
jgi:Fe2+ transport system protein B